MAIDEQDHSNDGNCNNGTDMTNIINGNNNGDSNCDGYNMTSFKSNNGASSYA